MWKCQQRVFVTPYLKKVVFLSTYGVIYIFLIWNVSDKSPFFINCFRKLSDGGSNTSIIERPAVFSDLFILTTSMCEVVAILIYIYVCPYTSISIYSCPSIVYFYPSISIYQCLSMVYYLYVSNYLFLQV